MGSHNRKQCVSWQQWRQSDKALFMSLGLSLNGIIAQLYLIVLVYGH